MKISSVLKLSALAACVTLAACGGGDGDGYGDNYGDNDGNDGGNNDGGNNGGNDVTPLSANITSSETLMGSTFTVSGQVTVLQSDGTLQNQSKTNFSLYTFDSDSLDSSSCSGDCATNWPPLVAADTDADRPPLTKIDRGDGNMQWALRGQPLYFFNNEQSALGVGGEGAANGAWHVAVDEPTATFEDQSVGVFLTASGKTLSSTGADSSSVKSWDGWTLFTRTADVPGETSTCTDQCLVTWPALLAEEGDVATPPYSLIDRPAAENLGKQWAYHGKPLYFRAADGGPQVIDGASDAWPLARPVTVKINGNRYVAAGLSQVASVNGGQVEINAEPSDGMSLYTFANDTDGASSCDSTCLQSWPALMAPSGAVPFGPFTLATIAGTTELQWALNGQPLYLHSGDNAPGDTIGDGAGNGSWNLAVADVPPQDVTIEQLQADIFTPRCSSCHGENNPSANLSLNSVENSYNGLLDENNPRVIAGNADGSLLVHKVEGQNDQGDTVSIMPPSGDPLSDSEVASIRAWIDDGAQGPAGVEPPENVTIEQLQTDIFTPRCAGCHNGSATPSGGLSLNNVENSYNGLLDLDDLRVIVGDADASLLVHKVEGQNDQGDAVSIMPPSGDPLSDLEIASIRVWIEEGAKPPASVQGATIEDLQANIFDDCVGCHSGATPQGNLGLDDVQTSFDQLVDGNRLVIPNDADASFLVHKVEGVDDNGDTVNNRMPQGGKLSAIQIASIRDWIDNGADEPEAVDPPAATLSDVQAIVDDNCGGCHINGGSSGGLNMDAANIFANLVDGRRVVAGDPDASVLIRRLEAQDSTVMPPGGSLDADDIATVRSWIEAGALNN